MLSIKLITENEANGMVKEIYEDIKATMGWSFVPETFQMIAHDPSSFRFILGALQTDHHSRQG